MAWITRGGWLSQLSPQHAMYAWHPVWVPRHNRVWGSIAGALFLVGLFFWTASHAYFNLHRPRGKHFNFLALDPWEMVSLRWVKVSRPSSDCSWEAIFFSHSWVRLEEVPPDDTVISSWARGCVPVHWASLLSSEKSTFTPMISSLPLIWWLYHVQIIDKGDGACTTLGSQS